MSLQKKIVILGDNAVGKTSLIRRFVFNQFVGSYTATIGTKITMKELKLRSHGQLLDIRFLIWDIIGQKEYRALISRFYKNANGALVVCDLTREDTLDNLKDWISSLYGAIGKVPIVLVANKYDLVDQNSFDINDLMEVSGLYGAPWITTSAKDGENVEHAFKNLAEQMIRDSLHFEKMNSLIDVLDAMIVDFCEVNGGLEIGMPLFKEEFTKLPGANLKSPDKSTVESLIEALTNITKSNKGKEFAQFQQERFSNWLKKVN